MPSRKTCLSREWVCQTSSANSERNNCLSGGNSMSAIVITDLFFSPGSIPIHSFPDFVCDLAAIAGGHREVLEVLVDLVAVQFCCVRQFHDLLRLLTQHLAELLRVGGRHPVQVHTFLK